MASLLPPSPSVSPRPNVSSENKNSRQSMGPSSRNNPAGLTVGSPRPGGVPGSARPTSELVGGNGLFQTPEGLSIFPPFFPQIQLISLMLILHQLKRSTHGSRIFKTTKSLWCVIPIHLTSRLYLIVTGRDGCRLSRSQLQGRVERH